MSPAGTCPECGANLTEEQARAGICPRCAMRLALDGPGGAPTAPPDPGGTEAGDVPERIGPYRVIRSIGEGGMGEVFLAEQREPIRRHVALKVIKRGLDTKHVVARFEVERQALALMDHASIAKVLDAGVTEDGRPYFVMEYVQGEPITAYADRKRLSLRQRLDLFGKVCAGVQHAHQKGVIHRDLKPSNVLVTQPDTEPIPKIIDFGVAKATSKRLTEQTLFTEMGIMIGTPEYMSPEQADVSAIDVDTRTDVYSLGVMLYELLTGALPFDPKELRRAGHEEIRRRIREEEPATPSSRISTLGEHATTAARARRIDVTSFRRELEGDLDWIVLRALAKEPDRRYGSPSEFSADVERYLTDEPVVARPPSAAYRTKKFVRRNKLLVASAAIILVTLLAGVAGTTTFGLRESRQRRATDAALADVEQVVEFQQGMLREIDTEAMGRRLVSRLRNRIEGPSAAESFDASLAGVNLTDAALDLLDEEILAAASEEIGERFADRPVVEGRLRLSLGRTYYDLGLLDQAAEQDQKAYELLRDALSEDEVLRYDAALELGRIHYQMGRFAESEPMYLEARDNYTRILGEEDENTIKAIGSLGLLYWRWGRLDEALSLNETALDRFRRTLGDEARPTIKAVDVLASTHQALGNLEQAETLYREGLDTAERVLGDDDPDTIRALGNLATVVFSAERLDEAEVLHQEAHARASRVFGETHYDTLAFYSNVAAVHSRRGDERAAEAIFREVVDKYHERVGHENEWSIRFRDNLAKCLLRQGRYDEGLEEWERVAEATSGHFGVGSTQAVRAWVLIALTKEDVKHETNRRRVIEKLKQALRATQGELDLPERWLNSVAWGLLVDYPEDLRDPELGLICAQRANELSNHENYAFLDTLALAYFQTGNVEAAIENGEKALELAPEDNPSARDEYAENLAKYETARDQITDSK